MDISLRTAKQADAPAVSALVQRVFGEFVALDWEPPAREVFATESSPERLVQLLAEPAFASVAEAGERLIGFILLPTPNLLSLLFVDSSAHRQGIATALWQAARAHLEAAYPAVKTVELNSSPYAIAAYKALGFYPISESFRRGGCVATRMACWLPGRALAAAHNAA
jgi:ribosomal protein S18 acetylase RimI-like enzyme